MDPLADAVRHAENAHTALIVAGAPERDIIAAYRVVLVAVLALAVDSGEDESIVLYEIEDVDAKLAA
jgi:hypothetical protein